MSEPTISRDAAHRYFYDGRQYPGVTSIIDVAGASFDAASRYGANQTAEAAIELLDGGGLQRMVDTLGKPGAIKGLAGAGVKRRDEAASLGSEVHRLADLVVNGTPTPPMGEAVRIRVLAYAKWWEEKLREGYRLRLSEFMIVRPSDPDGVEPGWGGTGDLLMFDPDGKTVLSDIKTGKLYSKAVLQLAGYSMGTLVQPATDNVITNPPKVYPMPVVDRYSLINVTADGVREAEVSVSTPERMAFLACLDLWHWQESMKGKKL